MRSMTIPWPGYKSCSASPLGLLAYEHHKSKCRVCARWKLSYPLAQVFGYQICRWQDFGHCFSSLPSIPSWPGISLQIQKFLM